MTSCEQTAGISVLEHGEQVRDYYCDLVNYLRGGQLKYEWRLPEWLTPALLPYLLSDEVMGQYHVFHDCGKPYCLTIDGDGRRHFTDHEQVSASIARQLELPSIVTLLIGQDMDIHRLKDVGITDFCKRSHAIALLLTGLSEIHANASMFGGISSQSFKQKWKQINKRGKKIVLNLQS